MPSGVAKAADISVNECLRQSTAARPGEGYSGMSGMVTTPTVWKSVRQVDTTASGVQNNAEIIGRKDGGYYVVWEDSSDVTSDFTGSGVGPHRSVRLTAQQLGSSGRSCCCLIRAAGVDGCVTFDTGHNRGSA